MRLVNSIEDFKPKYKSAVISIGTFDGLHSGHMALLRHLIELSYPNQESIVITFSNHPSEIIKPDHPTPLLCSLDHKIKLLNELPIDTTILLPFTKEFSEQSAALFIERLRTHVPFSKLNLGYDTQLGKDRHGDRAVLQHLSRSMGFEVEYINEYSPNNKPISSSHIRHAVKIGNFNEVRELLGRPYSIYAPIVDIQNNELKLEIKNLCLPPHGTYQVTLLADAKKYRALAHLNGHEVILVSLLEAEHFNQDSIRQSVEIIFEKVQTTKMN